MADIKKGGAAPNNTAENIAKEASGAVLEAVEIQEKYILTLDNLSDVEALKLRLQVITCATIMMQLERDISRLSTEEKGMSNSKKDIRTQIESLLDDLWEEGYKIGQNDQWNEDEAKLPEQLEDAYEKGYDKGFEQGRASTRKEVSE